MSGMSTKIECPNSFPRGVYTVESMSDGEIFKQQYFFAWVLFVKAIPPSNPFLGLLQKEKKPVRPYLATGGNLIRKKAASPLTVYLGQGR